MSDPSFDFVEPTAPGLVTSVEQPAVEDSARRRSRRPRFVGSGLRPWELALILAVSTTAFLFWGGPLWDAPVGTSHAWRIGGSYFIVIPLVLAALARARRASLGHFLGAVGILWSAKMLITATLYVYVAPESATQYAPARPWERPADSDPIQRRAPSVTPSVTETGSGDLAGVIIAIGGPEHVREAAVIVEDLPELPFARPPVRLDITIEDARYGRSVYLAAPQDRIALANRDASLHTLRLTQDRRAIANIPIPAGSGEQVIATPAPGHYQLSCENHASERALLVIVDHPFFALTDPNGRFELPGVPAGERTVAVLRSGHVPSRRVVMLAPSTRLELTIEVR